MRYDLTLTKAGDKVVFTAEGGRSSDIEEGSVHLVLGETYTVTHSEIGGWHTDVWLKEVPGIAFNSCIFKNLRVETMENAVKDMAMLAAHFHDTVCDQKCHPDCDRYSASVGLITKELG